MRGRWSKRRRREYECERKTTYDTEFIADAVASSIRRMYPGNPTIRPYRCGWCGHWHIGHAPGTRGRPVSTGVNNPVEIPNA